MGRFTFGIMAGTVIGMGALMMMDPKTRKKTKRVRRDGAKVLNRAGNWIDEVANLYK